MRKFSKEDLRRLHRPAWDSIGEDNGLVTIIGGSELFHGAPILSLKVASRMVDLVFFATPSSSVGGVAERIKSKLMSFIWVPWEGVGEYIRKSDAVLIGPGLMRYRGDKTNIPGQYDKVGQETREITERLLRKFSDKAWVIDAGSLQTMDPEWIPKKAILTPNRKEFELLFGVKTQSSNFKSTTQRLKVVQEKAKQYDCIIVWKGSYSFVCSAEECVEIKGGNPGLTHGGTGDVLAGLTVGLLAKNDPFLAASAAVYLSKMAADELYSRVGPNYNADDLVDEVVEVFGGEMKINRS